MSASRKKMLRREENKAAMTERQKKEMKEARKLRLYTFLFAAAIVLMVAVVIGVSIVNGGIIERHTTGMTVNDSDISVVELNYFYVDSINSYMNTYGSYISMMGLDTSLALDEQYIDEENGETWADYMLEMAGNNAKYSYALYQDAKANGFNMSDEAQQTIDANIESLRSYASMYGYSNANGYLKAMYGNGSNESSYRHYLTVQSVANEYYNSVVDSMEYTDADLRAAEAENYNKYSSFSYNYYYLSAELFYEGGTADDEGVVTYTDEEKAAGVAACKKVAEDLAASASLEDLEAAIVDLNANADPENAGTTAVEDVLYSNVDSSLKDWVTAQERKEGDITCIESSYTSTGEDGSEENVISGYYVVYFVGSNDNTYPLKNVRHILLQHEGGTTDEDGNTTYSDAEKEATLEAAEALLNSFKEGVATEDAFATLANEHSEDTGSNTTGGLYENVYPGQMVASFNDWCFDESRQPGDTGIVESEYGYHIMYFCGDSDMNYRDFMITSDLRSADTEEWESSIVDAATMEIVNDSKVNKSLTVSAPES